MRTKYLLLLLLSYIKVICNVTRSVIGIRGLESESVKNNSDSNSDSYQRIQGEE